MKAWYTLHTKPNSEFQVATTLHRRGIETYLPEFEPSDNQQPPKPKPFFPCYLFVKVDFQETGLSQVQWTPGLRRVVGFDNQPLPLPESVITFIQRQLAEFIAAKDGPGHSFQPGDTVRITVGPFQDMLAIFEGDVSSEKRVQILLQFLGRVSRMQLPVASLEKAENTTSQPPQPGPSRRTRGKGRPIKNQHSSQEVSATRSLL